MFKVLRTLNANKEPLFLRCTRLEGPRLLPSRATVQVFQVNKGKLGRLGRPIADSNWSGRSTKSSPPLLPGFSVNKRSLPTCEGWGHSKRAVVMVFDNAKHCKLNVSKSLSTSNSKCTIYAASRALIIHLMLELLT